MARRHVLGDAYEPLAALWRAILDDPSTLADAYEALWSDARPDSYERVRASFNRRPEPAPLLYLLARCVKGAVRFNAKGDFNQAADRRRRGRDPSRMRDELERASLLLRDKTDVVAADFEATIATASRRDLVYMDPPYTGTTEGRDRRYRTGLPRERLVEALATLVRRRVPVLVSYDGTTGGRAHGEDLPAALGLTKILLPAGRSAQATLLGRDERTVESLYVRLG